MQNPRWVKSCKLSNHFKLVWENNTYGWAEEVRRGRNKGKVKAFVPPLDPENDGRPTVLGYFPDQVCARLAVLGRNNPLKGLIMSV